MQLLTKFLALSSLTPWLKRFSVHCIAVIFFLSNFSCESPKQDFLIDKEDRAVVDDFLQYIAISELGVYTILGSKPVTQCHIPELRTEDELQAQYKAMPEDFRKRISFKRFDMSKRIAELREVCNKWVKIQYKYIGEHFAIHFDEEMHSCFLVNIPLVIYVLREHYQDFSKALGIDFDPAIVSREIGNKSSEFWKIFKKSGNSFLWGLLFGYGEKNSKLFQWEKEESISFPFRGTSYNSLWLKKRRLLRRAFGEKIENLDIPQFVIYQPIDEIVGKYIVEKERIIQIYKKKDFAETTVAFLKGEAPGQLTKRKKIISPTIKLSCGEERSTN